MKSKFAKCLGLVAALLLSASVSQQMAEAQTGAASSLTPTKLIIDGENINDVLSDGTKLNDALETMGNVVVSPGPGQIGKRIAALRIADAAGASGLPGLSGINGMLGREILNAASSAIQGGNGSFNPGRKVEISLSGQITQYYFNQNDNSGYLAATTIITQKVTAGASQPTMHVTAYRWAVAVTAGTYSVRTNSGDRNDPFPGTIPFAGGALDKIEASGFNKKLWAEGTGIVIVSVEVDNDYDPANPQFQLLDPTKNKNKNLYTTDSGSCIDMLFVGEPPATFAELEGPPTYCLGRCQQPLLVNTGI